MLERHNSIGWFIRKSEENVGQNRASCPGYFPWQNFYNCLWTDSKTNIRFIIIVFHCLYRFLGSFCAALLISITLPGYAAEPGQDTVTKEPTQHRYEKLLQTVRQNPPATGAIICIGSSHMERWKTVTNDLAPLRIYNYGVGGSRMAQAADLYIVNLAIPYKPRAVILYEGSNDLAGGVNPDDILQDFKRLYGKLHNALPETRLYVLGIVASPGKRFEKISDTKRANDLLQKECELHSWMKFIDTTSPLIGADGLPKTECFIPNNVHMTPAGYAAWKAAIGPVVLPAERVFEK